MQQLKTALLVIDHINGIMNGSCKDYASHFPIVANANKLIDACRNKHIPIYFIRVAFDPSYSDIPKHSKLFNQIKDNGFLKLGEPSAEFIDELNINANDIIITKKAVSPFCGHDLHQQLQAQHIERLIFTGVATDNAINLGTREAHDMGYHTIIAEDACGASTEQAHQMSITLLEKIANEITSTDSLIQKLK